MIWALVIQQSTLPNYNIITINTVGYLGFIKKRHHWWNHSNTKTWLIWLNEKHNAMLEKTWMTRLAYYNSSYSHCVTLTNKWQWKLKLRTKSYYCTYMSDRCEFPMARQYRPKQNINLITMNDSFTWKFFSHKFNSLPFNSRLSLKIHSIYFRIINAKENWEILNDGKESNKSGYNLRSLVQNKSHIM